MDKDELNKINNILVNFIKEHDPEKEWIFSMDKSEEWLNATYKNHNKLTKGLYKELIRAKKQILSDLDEIGEEVKNKVMEYYIDHKSKIDELYEDIVLDNYTEIINITLDEVAKIVGEASLGISFDLLNEEAKVFLMNKRIKFAVAVANTTHQAIINELAKGFELGEGISELAERIKDMPEFSISRAKIVSRTEIISSSNAGTHQGYIESGVVIGKEWINTADSKTRLDHVFAGGQRKKLNEPFIVGGETLMYPGDNSLGASARNIIQCRCTTIPILEGEVI